MNLRYEFEGITIDSNLIDPKKFKLRLSDAEKKRKLHEALVRYTGTLLEVNNELSETSEVTALTVHIPVKTIERIMHLAFQAPIG